MVVKSKRQFVASKKYVPKPDTVAYYRAPIKKIDEKHSPDVVAYYRAPISKKIDEKHSPDVVAYYRAPTRRK